VYPGQQNPKYVFVNSAEFEFNENAPADTELNNLLLLYSDFLNLLIQLKGDFFYEEFTRKLNINY